MFSSRAALLSCVTVILLACGASTNDTEVGPDATHQPAALSVMTFNAGLVRGGVALVNERLPHIAPALAATGADVICLNEVWDDQDYDRIRSSLAPTHPNTFRAKTVDSGHLWFQCNPIQLFKLNQCVSNKCTSGHCTAP